MYTTHYLKHPCIYIYINLFFRIRLNEIVELKTRSFRYSSSIYVRDTFSSFIDN